MGKKISMCEPISGTDFPKLSDAKISRLPIEPLNKLRAMLKAVDRLLLEEKCRNVVTAAVYAEKVKRIPPRIFRMLTKR
jgi:hypothetical protein